MFLDCFDQIGDLRVIDIDVKTGAERLIAGTGQYNNPWQIFPQFCCYPLKFGSHCLIKSVHPLRAINGDNRNMIREFKTNAILGHLLVLSVHIFDISGDQGDLFPRIFAPYPQAFNFLLREFLVCYFSYKGLWKFTAEFHFPRAAPFNQGFSAVSNEFLFHLLRFF